VCLVPSRSESFGLVALEAAACGIPVVAANVGGLRSLVVHGETGFLVDDRDPAIYAKHVAQVLDDPLLGADLGITAAARARRYSWPDAAARLRDVCLGLRSSALVSCD
jgi:D-inositol-3-phosphate glycosyltransferase